MWDRFIFMYVLHTYILNTPVALSDRVEVHPVTSRVSTWQAGRVVQLQVSSLTTTDCTELADTPGASQPPTLRLAEHAS